MADNVREMTFDEEYEILQKEKEELFATEKEDCEPHFANCVVRRALRCIRKLLEEIRQYREIGTLEEVRNAVEKQIPKSPTYEGDGYAPDGTFVWDEWICPCCGSRFEVEYDDYDYCPNCGQHINWSEEE